MKKWTMALTIVFFLVPEINYAQLRFAANPLVKAPFDKYPYYAVGLISQSGDYPYLRCTGFPIAPTVILTAAHCLYDWNERKWEGELFYFTATSVLNTNNPIKAKTYILPREFVDSAMLPETDIFKGKVFDFGVMILERELDESVSSVFSLVFEDDPQAAVEVPEIPLVSLPSRGNGNIPFPMKSDNYRMLVGYSGVDYEREGVSTMLRASLCPIVPYWRRDNQGQKRYAYAHRCSTTGGMSGGPIFYREASNTYRIVSIHHGGYLSDGFNNGIFINYDKFVRIEYWKNNKKAAVGKDVINTFL